MNHNKANHERTYINLANPFSSGYQIGTQHPNFTPQKSLSFLGTQLLPIFDTQLCKIMGPSLFAMGFWAVGLIGDSLSHSLALSIRRIISFASFSARHLICSLFSRLKHPPLKREIWRREITLIDIRNKWICRFRHGSVLRQVTVSSCIRFCKQASQKGGDFTSSQS